MPAFVSANGAANSSMGERAISPKRLMKKFPAPSSTSVAPNALRISAKFVVRATSSPPHRSFTVSHRNANGVPRRKPSTPPSKPPSAAPLTAPLMAWPKNTFSGRPRIVESKPPCSSFVWRSRSSVIWSGEGRYGRTRPRLAAGESISGLKRGCVRGSACVGSSSSQGQPISNRLLPRHGYAWRRG